MRRPLAAVLALLAPLGLGGCAATVTLTPAPEATSPACAGVIVRMPPSIAGADRRNTDAQGTAAWGTPAAVTLRCGVATPTASTDTCYPVDGVDWLLDDQRVAGRPVRVLTTFGREPGIQVVVSDPVSANDVLSVVSETVAGETRRTDLECRGESDLDLPS